MYITKLVKWINKISRYALLNKRKWILIIAVVVLATIFLFFYASYKTGLITIASISSDGRYVITTDADKNAVLWDIENKKKTILSKSHAAIYSAYWIKKTPYFVWQEIPKGGVQIQSSLDLSIIKKLDPWAMIFGQVISSDLKYNVFGDSAWGVYVGLAHEAKLMIHGGYNAVPGFDGANKLINFTLLGNDKLLTSGLPYYNSENPEKSLGIDLWDLNTRTKIQSYIGNQGKTFATISPDGKYVVAGDEGGKILTWETDTGKKLLVNDDTVFGRFNPKMADPNKAYDSSVIIAKQPNDFGDGDAANNGVVAIKFIDSTHYLAFISRDNHADMAYAILYQVDDPRALKYLPLGRHPYPALSYYERDQAIDTSPSAHILVMGKDDRSGILVYKYDPDKQTLTKIWDAH